MLPVTYSSSLFHRNYREYKIKNIWTGERIDHRKNPMILRFDQLDENGYVKITASGPFFDDLPPPSPPGEMLNLRFANNTSHP